MKGLYYFFVLIFFILLVLSIASSYYKFQIAEDYVIESQVTCEPSQESCFMWQCDPETEGDCTGNPDEDIFYYKIAYRNAQNISCNDVDECDYLCEIGEKDCGEVLCDESNGEEAECYTEISAQLE